MNKNFSYIVFGLILTGLSFHAAAQDDLKVGYVNVSAVFAASPQKAAAEKSIKKEFTARQEKLKELQSEVQALREKYNREAITMSESDLRGLMDKMVAAERKLEWEKKIFEEDLKIQRAQILGDVEKDIKKAILKISQDGKYDLVLSEGVIFSSARVNLTDEILEQLKK